MCWCVQSYLGMILLSLWMLVHTGKVETCFEKTPRLSPSKRLAACLWSARAALIQLGPFEKSIISSCKKLLACTFLLNEMTCDTSSWFWTRQKICKLIFFLHNGNAKSHIWFTMLANFAVKVTKFSLFFLSLSKIILIFFKSFGIILYLTIYLF